MPPDEPLDHLGAFLIRTLYGRGLYAFDAAASGKMKSEEARELHARLSAMPEADRTFVRTCVERSLRSALHDFLFELVVEADGDGRVKLVVDGKDATTLSDGLQGELFGDTGWLARFSTK